MSGKGEFWLASLRRLRTGSDLERVHRTWQFSLAKTTRPWQAQMTSCLAQISSDTSFPSPGVAVHTTRKQCVEGLHFVRKKCTFYLLFVINLVVYYENNTKTTWILKTKVFNAFSTRLRIHEKMLQIGFFPSLSLLSSLILRYFGDHGHVSQRSIRFKVLNCTHAKKRSKAMNRHKFTWLHF